MKIRQKIIAGFLAISLLIPLLSYINLRSQQKLLGNFDYLGTEMLPRTIAMIKIEAELYSALMATMLYGQTGNNDSRQEVEKALAGLADYQVIHDLHHSSVMPEMMNEINKILQQFSRQISQYILARKKNSTQKQLSELKLEIDKTVTHYKKLVDSDKDIREAAHLVTVSLKRNDQMLSIMMYLSLTIFIIALSFSLFLSRLLSRPLINLNRATLAIADGKFDHRVDETGSDEIAELATSFNFMADALYRSNKKLQEEVVKKEKALQLAETSDRIKGELIANMSHELRTPLNSIIGFSELILDQELNDKQRDFQQSIHQSARSLLSILQGIMDYSLINDGILVIGKQEFYLPDVLTILMQRFTQQAEEQGLDFFIRVEDDVPLYLQGSKERLEQILVYLLDNSLKFTEQGRVSIELSVESSESEKCYLHFAVIDTGIGMTSDVVENIFDPFYQKDAGSTRQYGGVGMGLTVAGELVRLMKGELEVVSKPGQGSTFSFLVPYNTSIRRPETFSSLSDSVFTGHQKMIPPHFVAEKVYPQAAARNKAEQLTPKAREGLLELNLLMKNKDFQVVEKWQQLQASLVAVDKTRVAQIDRAISKFEFETALELLNSLLNK